MMNGLFTKTLWALVRMEKYIRSNIDRQVKSMQSKNTVKFLQIEF